MRKADILLEVKKAEERVESLKQEALREKERLIRESKKEALRILEDAKASAHSSQRVKLEAVHKEMEVSHRKIIGEGEQKAWDLKSRARGNAEKAIGHLIKRFESEVMNV